MVEPEVPANVNTTLFPPHMLGPLLETIAAVGNDTTVMVTALEVAGELVKHGLAFDVITTVTASLLANVVAVNVDAVCPETLAPFTFHWYVGVVPPLVGVAVGNVVPTTRYPPLVPTHELIV